MKLKMLVIFGGMSSEHSISCISASNVIENASENKYDITRIGIDKNGIWYKYNGSTDNIKNNTWEQDENNKERVISVFNELKGYDIVFPVLHGKYGEDGTIQGLFELLNIKYVGCDHEGSSIGMDKILSKELVKSIKIPVVDYFYLTKYDFVTLELLNEKVDKNNLSFPLFVKPNKEGSSYGVKKANNIQQLYEAVNFAFQFDNKVLVERYVENKKEVECAVLGNYDLIISTPGEIVSAEEIYDFDSKYNNDKSYTKIPANIPNERQEMIKKYAKEIFKILNLSGLSRVDFFVTDDEIYFNEVNTMPGFTSISMYPKMMQYDKISYSEIIDRLVECGINR